MSIETPSEEKKAFLKQMLKENIVLKLYEKDQYSFLKPRVSLEIRPELKSQNIFWTVDFHDDEGNFYRGVFDFDRKEDFKTLMRFYFKKTRLSANDILEFSDTFEAEFALSEEVFEPKTTNKEFHHPAHYTLKEIAHLVSENSKYAVWEMHRAGIVERSNGDMLNVFRGDLITIFKEHNPPKDIYTKHYNIK